MKKAVFGTMVILLIAASACSSGGTGGGPQPTADVLPPVKASTQVEAEAVVVPVNWASLSFQMGGLVTAVEVREGDTVQAGDVLAQVDDSTVRLAIAEAEAALASAQAQLAQVKAGAQPTQLALAEQAIRVAEAAQAAAEAQLVQLQAGVRSADIAAAEAELVRAVDQEKQLQKNYDDLIKVIEEYGVGGGPPEEQLRAALAAAKVGTVAAQKRLNQVKAGPTKGQLDAAQANIAAATARVARAKAQLDLLKAGPRPEDIAVAEAGVQLAELAVTTAQAQLPKLQVVAPFDGVVVSLDVKEGEFASPGVPVVRLADLSAWQIETDDLTELNIVSVQEGSPAVVTFDAIPDLELAGHVGRIKALGENKRGDIVYTVIVQPDQHEARLRWNMTAVVAIEPK
ncbi:MAG: efflux RND transporter periplasmic adaptor subunit [Thermoflexales bacterium]|nr:efflux RND transporter periplasmic adaptor subunit [Thermoflexales bacterium]